MISHRLTHHNQYYWRMLERGSVSQPLNDMHHGQCVSTVDPNTCEHQSTPNQKAPPKQGNLQSSIDQP